MKDEAFSRIQKVRFIWFFFFLLYGKKYEKITTTTQTTTGVKNMSGPQHLSKSNTQDSLQKKPNILSMDP